MPYSLDKLLATVQDTVVNKKFHPHYERVCGLARKYKILITGHEFEELLEQFIRREDLELFNQRKRITQPITPAITAAIMNPFYKVGRTNNITRKIDFKSENENKTVRLTDAINYFWGEKSLDKYLETRFTELSFSDPNSFIVTEFDQFPDENGVMSDIPKPRAFEVSSENAVNYEFHNNKLEYLVVRLPITLTQKNSQCEGHSYTIYGPDYSIKFTQISIDSYSATPQLTYIPIKLESGADAQLFRANETELFIVQQYNHKSKVVPAKRVGYKSDLVTNGETCVNPFHDAMAYLMKSVKTVSEFDLTMALHAFPQKFAYAPRCLGESVEIGCNNGQTSEGATCGKCKGSGLALHTTTQDAIIMRLPKDKDEMMNLANLVYYVSPPIDLVKFQNDYIFQLKDEVKQAVFNSEIFSKTEVANTATEKKISLESVYDTLFPYAENFSDMFKHIATVSAYYVDIEDAVIIHQFPKDFKFKTLEDLLNELKLANDSNAPGYVRKELSNDIAEVQFIDRPEDLQRIRTKAKFYPFADKTDTEIIYGISNGKTTKEKEILWFNFDDIFNEIEEDESTRDVFYSMPFSKQKEIVDKKVLELMARIDSGESGSAVPFSGLDPSASGADINTPNSVEAEAKAKLKGSVGGVEGILSIQSSVATGTTDYDAAIALLYEIFGFDEETAKRILGTPKAAKVVNSFGN